MPIEKEKYAPRGSSYAVQKRFADKQRARDKRIANLWLKQCEASVYDWRGHGDSWRNKIAKDLNKLLGQCEYSLAHDPGVDLEWVKATLRIVKRVAEFEGIKKVATK